MKKTRVKHITKHVDALGGSRFEDIVNRAIAKIEGNKGEIIGVSLAGGDEWDSVIITYRIEECNDNKTTTD